jgi:hypothetical protein
LTLSFFCTHSHPPTRWPRCVRFVGRDLKALCSHAAGACILRVGSPASCGKGLLKEVDKAKDVDKAAEACSGSTLRICAADFDQALTQVSCYPPPAPPMLHLHLLSLDLAVMVLLRAPRIGCVAMKATFVSLPHRSF